MHHLEQRYSCIILAGGEGRRVSGRDKGLIEFCGKPLIHHVIDAVCDQVDDIVISANRNISRYESLGYQVIHDDTEGYQGPMAGIASCLQQCRHDHVLVVSCDMPGLPLDLVERLSSAGEDTDITVAATDDCMQLAFILNRKLYGSLRQALTDGERRMMRWVTRQSHVIVEFEDRGAFRNYNHSADLA